MNYLDIQFLLARKSPLLVRMCMHIVACKHGLQSTLAKCSRHKATTWPCRQTRCTTRFGASTCPWA